MGGRGAWSRIPRPVQRFPVHTRDRHFRDHGEDFGAGSALEYEDLALAFASRRGENGIESFVSADGVVFMYEPSTNTYFLHCENGALMTFMKPTSKTYWQRQRGESEPTE